MSLVAGHLSLVGSVAAAQPRVETKDMDADGTPDLWTTYDGSRPVGLERDRNGDGTPDTWRTYTYPTEGEPRGQTTSVDRDFDGTPDYWRAEQNGKPVREWGDLNADGRVDHWTIYSGGRKQWAVMDKNFDGRPDAWFFYGVEGTQAAVLGIPRPVAGEIDEDFDGTPERTFGALPADRPTLDEKPSAPPSP